MTPDFSKKVALFGGSFDPIHEGHLQVAAAVEKNLPEIQVTFVPAFQNPEKAPPQAPAFLRLDWIKGAIAKTQFTVWDFELEKKGPSYTVDTLREAHRLGAVKENLFWILGADAYESLPQWREYGALRSLCHFIVLNRPSASHPKLLEADRTISMPAHPATSSACRMALAETPPRFLHLPPNVRGNLENLILLSKNPYARKMK